MTINQKCTAPICFTLLFFTWMIRDSLCELHIKQGSYELAAFLACNLKE
ncbi:type I toxin-antitoxin system toxin HokA [Escherichia coli]|nr:type I toxin-antitoxin system toxin HokA [Escherichia coli]